jgi:uncharacterized protein (DUF58 family)
MPGALQPELLQQIGSLEFFARQAVEGFITGLHRSPFHGFSVEFAEHRLYNAGESTRHIDWKLFARTDKMFVKRFEEETNLRCQLVLDTSASMHYPVDGSRSKLGFSVESAAALIELFRRQRDAVGLSTFAAGLEAHFPAKSSRVHQRALYHRLDQVLERPRNTTLQPTDAATALHELAEAIPRRSLVMIFSDFFERGGELDALLGALQHLRHAKHEVVVFHTQDRVTEVEFAFEDRPTVFVDPESGEEVRLHPAGIRDAYKASMHAFRQELDLCCAQYGIDRVEVDIEKGVYPVLSSYLVKRRKMRA